MIFEVDTTSAIPIYAQIMTQVKHGIASGLLCPGDGLPSQRELAARLRVNPLTVARAYRDLEHEGLVVSGQGRGTFIADTPISTNESYRLEALERAVERLLMEAYQLGATPEEIRLAVNNRLREREGGPVAPGERGGGESVRA